VLGVATTVPGGAFDARLRVPDDTAFGDYVLFCNLSFNYPLGYYTTGSSSVPVHVSKGTALTLGPAGELGDDVVVRGRESNFTGTLRDNEGRSIPGAVIHFAIGDEDVASVLTDARGNYSVTVSIPFHMPLGPVNISVRYGGNENYVASSAKREIYVYSTVEIVLDGGVFFWNDIDITGVLRDDHLVPLDMEGEVDVFIGDSHFPDVPVSGGEFGSSGQHIEDSGNISVTVRFDRDKGSFYLESENHTVLRIISRLIITITEPVLIDEDVKQEEPVICYGGGTLFLNGTVNYEYGISEMKPPLTFELVPEDESIKTIARNITVNRFNLTWQIPTDLEAGDYVFRIRLEPSDEFFYELEPLDVSLRIRQYTDLSVSANWDRTRNRIYVDGSAFHMDSPSTPAVKSSVTVYSEGREITTVPVDKYGAFTCNYSVEDELGEVVITAVLLENDYYARGENTTMAFVMSQTVVTLLLPDDGEMNSTFFGNVSLFSRGNPVVGATIVVVMYDAMGDFRQNITVITGRDGRGNFTGRLNAQSALSIDAIFNGSAIYDKNHTFGSIGISERKSDPTPMEQVVEAFAGASPLFLLVICLVFGAAGWRRYKARALVKAVHDARMRILQGGNVAKAIIEAYNQMSFHLAGYNFRRKVYETVDEFKIAVRESTKLSEDGIGSLTSLFEIVDYGDMEVDPEHKDFAVDRLSRVERELTSIFGGDN